MNHKHADAISEQFLEGKVLLFDKPLYWTSHDVIKKLRWILKIKKIGHAGTLDPLATGLLIACTGKFTKKINAYMGMEKEYTGTFTAGATTPTYDLESRPENFTDTAHLDENIIVEATKKFMGEIMQTPPVFSAIKQQGKPVYLAARKGDDVVLQPRPVTIYAFDITRIALPEIDFKIVCSTGTYIRSMANDFGAALGTGAYLSKLCRTRIGEFGLHEAQSIVAFEEEIKQLRLEASEGQTNT